MQYRATPYLSRLLVFALVMIALVALVSPVARARPDQGISLAAALAPPHARDRVIVGFEPAVSVARRDHSTATIAVASVEEASPLAADTIVVELAEGQSVTGAIRDIGSRPGVAYVEPDYRVRAAATPDDPRYTNGEQWGMYGAATSPANLFGSAAGEAWAGGVVGASRVVVGVVDEGIKTSHPDLAANIWSNPWEAVNGLDDDANGYVDDVNGWDFYHDDASVYDGTVDDHGTHVAGIIGARGGNGTGVAGAAWRVTLVSAKFLGPGGGYVSDAIAAIDYLTDLKIRHGLAIVATNSSWSGGGYSQALSHAIDRAGDAGILVVAAAGNDGHDIDASPVYPAAYRCVTRADGSERAWDCLISVASIGPDGNRAADSNWAASSVDLGAPGSAILSTHPDGSDGYTISSGTSMAAAHVSGAAALCAGQDPTLTARQIRTRIMDTAAATDSLAGHAATGGRLDIGELVERCTPAPEPNPAPTPAPTPTPAPPAEARTILVDDRDPAFERTGPGWKQGPTGHADHHYWLPTRKDAGRNLGQWRPALDRAGWYHIRVYIPIAHATTKNAVYKVSLKDGWATRARNQRKWRGSWISLGTHWLTTRPTVKLSDRTGEAASLGLRIAFDAMRFIPVDRPEP